MQVESQGQYPSLALKGGASMGIGAHDGSPIPFAARCFRGHMSPRGMSFSCSGCRWPLSMWRVVPLSPHLVKISQVVYFDIVITSIIPFHRLFGRLALFHVVFFVVVCTPPSWSIRPLVLQYAFLVRLHRLLTSSAGANAYIRISPFPLPTRLILT